MAITLEQMRADIAAMIHEDPEEIGLDDNLMDLGLDSMRVMNLLVKWTESGVDFDFGEAAEGRLRFCFARSVATIETALARLEPVLAKLASDPIRRPGAGAAAGGARSGLEGTSR